MRAWSVKLIFLFACATAIPPVFAQSESKIGGSEAKPEKSAGWMKLKGYAGLNWGMSPGDVERIVGLPVLKRKKDYLMFSSYGCDFRNGKLYSIQTDSKLSASETEQTLIFKYGAPTRTENRDNSSKRIWDDGVSSIVLEHISFPEYSVNNVFVRYSGLAEKAQAHRKSR